MNSFSYDPDIFAASHAQAIREQERCEHLACEYGAIDSELSDACRFDAGALFACQHVLKALQRGDDVLADVTALIHLIAELNDDRENN